MAYTNQYDRYLQSPDETQSSGLFGKALGLSAVGLAAYGMYKGGFAKYIAPRLSNARRYFETSNALTGALGEVIDQRGVTGLFDDAGISSLRKSFIDRMTGAQRYAGDTLGGAPTEIVRRMSELGASGPKLIKDGLSSLRSKTIMNEIEFHTRGQVTGDEIFSALRPHLEAAPNSFFSAVNQNDIAAVVKASGLTDTGMQKIATDVITDSIRSQAARFNLTSRGLPSLTDAEKQWVRNYTKNARVQIEKQFVEDMKVQDTFFNRMMENGGLRVATVGDLVKQGAFNDTVRTITRLDAAKRNRSIQSTLDWNKRLTALMRRNPEVANLRADSGIFIDANDRLMDLRHVGDTGNRALQFFANNFQMPFVNINPLRLMHWISIQGVKNAPFFEILQKGTVQPVISGSASPLSRNYMYVGGKVFDLESGSTLVKDNVYLASGRFGLFPRALSSMAGLERSEVVAKREAGGIISKVFDWGYQDSMSDIAKVRSVATKFWDPNWGRNQYMYASRKLGELQYDVASGAYESIEEAFAGNFSDAKLMVGAYKSAYNIVNQKAEVLSADSMEKLGALVSDKYGLAASKFATRTDESVMFTIGDMMTSKAREKLVPGSPVEELMTRYINLYNEDPIKFANSPRVLTDELPNLPGMLSALETEGTTRLVSQFEDAKRVLQQDVIYQLQMMYKDDLTVSKLVRGMLTGNEADKVEELMLLNRLRGKDSNIFKNVFRPMGAEAQIEGASTFLSEMANSQNAWYNETLGKTIAKYTPMWGAGPGLAPPDHFGPVRSLVIGRSGSPLKAINEAIKRGEGIGSVLKAAAESTVGQIGFGPASIRAGRENLDKVTTATVISYYMFGRLNEALAKAGLGLSNQSLGSAQSVYLNLIGRRLLLPLMAMGYAGYANYLFPGDPMGMAADTYVGARLDMARIKDATGITSLQKRWGQVFQGADQLGELMIGKAITGATFGLIGDTRSYQELAQYYSSGNEPIRKGRYWPAGSNTPWSGGRVDFFAPNWYRRLKTDYMMSDVMYGSRGEYYANQWYPTLENPLGPLNSIVFSPHHYAYKHREDRPYPSTGGAAVLEEVPIFGPAASKIAGMFGIAPDIERSDLSKAHRDYLRSVNEAIKARGEAGQGYIYSTPAGGTSLVNVYPSDTGEGTGTGGGSTIVVAGTAAGGIPIIGTAGSGGTASRNQLKGINQAIVSRGAIKAMRYAPGSINRGFEDIADLDEVAAPGSAWYRAGETWYSLTEMAGIYGFSLTMGNNNPTTQALASATYMNSFSRRFWDANLGGLGGMVSEIFRRFVPNSKYRRQQYNPFRNTMPDWLPGPEYMTDFQHGDPYAKIPMGEARLPGAGYERLNRLHPDQFGEYGALDRLKILADVAPYSEQYTLYKNIVSRMDLSPQEKLEYAAAKKQVSQMKKKYRLYPYRFKNADVLDQEVHVTKVIDPNTFMTKEYPDHPIRLAGLHVPVSDPKSEEARQEIANVIYPGATVKVGIAADPLQRVANDVMQTMHAVVYTEWGRPLQAKLLRTLTDQVTEKATDFSPTGVRSRFYEDEITVGKMWEWFSHLDTPFHTKFLQVRSPLEMYKRSELYGKAWQPWYEPWGSIIKPTMEAISAKSPLVATGWGAFLGRLVGSGSKIGKGVGTTAGAITMGTLSTLRVFSETLTDGKRWIPARRQRERDINEYFDILKYLKFKGLYEKARKEAIDREGIDVSALVEEQASRGQKNTSQRKSLQAIKRWLKIEAPDDEVGAQRIKDKLSKINKSLTGIAADRMLTPLGPYSIQALYYNQQAQSTLYGVDEGGNMVDIYRALPKKDREFYQYFLKAAPEEREEILSLVPRNERRLYQARWGLELDPKVDLKEYFKSHYLPSPGWAGWKAGVSLEDIKLKVVQNEALDMTEFGFWDDDLKYAASAPELEPFKPTGFVGGLEARLKRVLKGAGLNDIDVRVTHGPAAEAHELNVKVDIERDRTRDILNLINSDTSMVVP